MHEHGNGRNITKHGDNISMEDEEAAREGIIYRHTDCKLEKFSHKRIDEQVGIPWLLWTRYDPNTKNVVLLEALVWREVIVKDEEDLCSMLLLFEWSEAISGEAEHNVMMI
jgi:hypothetical protein